MDNIELRRMQKFLDTEVPNVNHGDISAEQIQQAKQEVLAEFARAGGMAGDYNPLYDSKDAGDVAFVKGLQAGKPASAQTAKQVVTAYIFGQRPFKSSQKLNTYLGNRTSDAARYAKSPEQLEYLESAYSGAEARHRLDVLQQSTAIADPKHEDHARYRSLLTSGGEGEDFQALTPEVQELMRETRNDTAAMQSYKYQEKRAGHDAVMERQKLGEDSWLKAVPGMSSAARQTGGFAARWGKGLLDDMLGADIAEPFMVEAAAERYKNNEATDDDIELLAQMESRGAAAQKSFEEDYGKETFANVFSSVVSIGLASGAAAKGAKAIGKGASSLLGTSRLGNMVAGRGTAMKTITKGIAGSKNTGWIAAERKAAARMAWGGMQTLGQIGQQAALRAPVTALKATQHERAAIASHNALYANSPEEQIEQGSFAEGYLTNLGVDALSIGIEYLGTPTGRMLSRPLAKMRKPVKGTGLSPSVTGASWLNRVGSGLKTAGIGNPLVELAEEFVTDQATFASGLTDSAPLIDDVNMIVYGVGDWDDLSSDRAQAMRRFFGMAAGVGFFSGVGSARSVYGQIQRSTRDNLIRGVSEGKISRKQYKKLMPKKKTTTATTAEERFEDVIRDPDAREQLKGWGVIPRDLNFKIQAIEGEIRLAEMARNGEIEAPDGYAVTVGEKLSAETQRDFDAAEYDTSGVAPDTDPLSVLRGSHTMSDVMLERRRKTLARLKQMQAPGDERQLTVIPIVRPSGNKFPSREGDVRPDMELTWVSEPRLNDIADADLKAAAGGGPINLDDPVSAIIQYPESSDEGDQTGWRLWLGTRPPSGPDLETRTEEGYHFVRWKADPEVMEAQGRLGTLGANVPGRRLDESADQYKKRLTLIRRNMVMQDRWVAQQIAVDYPEMASALKAGSVDVQSILDAEFGDDTVGRQLQELIQANANNPDKGGDVNPMTTATLSRLADHLRDLDAPKVGKGAQVYVLMDTATEELGAVFRKGTVEQVNEDGSINVKFGEGDTMSNVPPKDYTVESPQVGDKGAVNGSPATVVQSMGDGQLVVQINNSEAEVTIEEDGFTPEWGEDLEAVDLGVQAASVGEAGSLEEITPGGTEAVPAASIPVGTARQFDDDQLLDADAPDPGLGPGLFPGFTGSGKYEATVDESGNIIAVRPTTKRFEADELLDEPFPLIFDQPFLDRAGESIPGVTGPGEYNIVLNADGLLTAVAEEVVAEESAEEPVAEEAVEEEAPAKPATKVSDAAPDAEPEAEAPAALPDVNGMKASDLEAEIRETFGGMTEDGPLILKNSNGDEVEVGLKREKSITNIRNDTLRQIVSVMRQGREAVQERLVLPGRGEPADSPFMKKTKSTPKRDLTKEYRAATAEVERLEAADRTTLSEDRKAALDEELEKAKEKEAKALDAVLNAEGPKETKPQAGAQRRSAETEADALRGQAEEIRQKGEPGAAQAAQELEERATRLPTSQTMAEGGATQEGAREGSAFGGPSVNPFTSQSWEVSSDDIASMSDNDVNTLAASLLAARTPDMDSDPDYMTLKDRSGKGGKQSEAAKAKAQRESTARRRSAIESILIRLGKHKDYSLPRGGIVKGQYWIRTTDNRAYKIVEAGPARIVLDPVTGKKGRSEQVVLDNTGEAVQTKLAKQFRPSTEWELTQTDIESEFGRLESEIEEALAKHDVDSEGNKISDEDAKERASHVMTMIRRFSKGRRGQAWALNRLKVWAGTKGTEEELRRVDPDTMVITPDETLIDEMNKLDADVEGKYPGVFYETLGELQEAYRTPQLTQVTLKDGWPDRGGDITGLGTAGGRFSTELLFLHETIKRNWDAVSDAFAKGKGNEKVLELLRDKQDPTPEQQRLIEYLDKGENLLVGSAISTDTMSPDKIFHISDQPLQDELTATGEVPNKLAAFGDTTRQVYEELVRRLMSGNYRDAEGKPNAGTMSRAQAKVLAGNMLRNEGFVAISDESGGHRRYYALQDKPKEQLLQGNRGDKRIYTAVELNTLTGARIKGNPKKGGPQFVSLKEQDRARLQARLEEEEKAGDKEAAEKTKAELKDIAKKWDAEWENFKEQRDAHNMPRLPTVDELALPHGDVENTANEVFAAAGPDGPTSEELSVIPGAQLPRKKNDRHGVPYADLLDREGSKEGRLVEPRSYKELKEMLEWALDPKRNVNLDWYNQFGQNTQDLIGEANMKEFAALFGITSAQKAAEVNYAETLHIMDIARRIDPRSRPEEFKAALWRATDSTGPDNRIGRPDPSKDGRAPGLGITESQVNQILTYYRTAKYAGGLKVSTYMWNVLDKAGNDYSPFSVQDVHMSRVFGADKRRMYKYTEEYVDDDGTLKTRDSNYDKWAEAERAAKKGKGKKSRRNPITYRVVDGAKFSKDAELRYAMYMTSRLARDYNIQPQQAQALLWFYAKENLSPKDDQEGAVVGDGTFDSATRFATKGIARIQEMVDSGEFNKDKPLYEGLDTEPTPFRSRPQRETNAASVIRKIDKALGGGELHKDLREKFTKDKPEPAELRKRLEAERERQEMLRDRAAADDYSNTNMRLGISDMVVSRSPQVTVSFNPGVERGYGFPKDVTLEELVTFQDVQLEAITDSDGQIRILKELNIPHRISRTLGTYDRMEPSILINLPGMDMDTADMLANLLGDALLQDGALTVKPDHTAPEWVADVEKKDGSKYTQQELEEIYELVNKDKERYGLNFTMSFDEKALSFFDGAMFDLDDPADYSIGMQYAFYNRMKGILSKGSMDLDVGMMGTVSNYYEPKETDEQTGRTETYQGRAEYFARRSGSPARSSVLLSRANDLLYEPAWESYRQFVEGRGYSPENQVGPRMERPDVPHVLTEITTLLKDETVHVAVDGAPSEGTADFFAQRKMDLHAAQDKAGLAKLAAVRADSVSVSNIDPSDMSGIVSGVVNVLKPDGVAYVSKVHDPMTTPAVAATEEWTSMPVDDFPRVLAEQEGDPGYVYHVTTKDRATRIQSEGFLQGQPQSMAPGWYAERSAGKLFFTEKSAVRFWSDRIEEHLDHHMDAPDAGWELVALRVRKSDIPGLTPDDVGTKDAQGRQAFFTESNLEAAIAEDPEQVQELQSLLESRFGSVEDAGTHFRASKPQPSSFRVSEGTNESLRQADASADVAAYGAFNVTAKQHKAVVSLFEGGNLSTLLHELGHYFRSQLTESENRAVERIMLRENRSLRKRDNGRLDWRNNNSEAEEYFAQEFQRYVSEGKTEANELTGVFEKFKSWLTGTLLRLPNTDKLSNEMRGFFDQMLSGEERRELSERISRDTRLAQAVRRADAVEPLPDIEPAPTAAAVLDELAKLDGWEDPVKKPKGLGRIARFLFRTEKLLPRPIFRALWRMKSQIRGAERDVKLADRELKRAIKKEWGKLDERNNALLNTFLSARDTRVRQEAADQLALAPRVFKAATEIRDKIDGVSRELQNKGVIQGDILKATVDANMQVYLNRSYRFFEEPQTWTVKHVRDKHPDRWMAAVDWLRGMNQTDVQKNRVLVKTGSHELRADVVEVNQQEGTATVRYMDKSKAQVPLTDMEAITVKSDEDLGRAVGDLLDRGTGQGPALTRILGEKDLGILKQKKEVPEALRRLWGEYEDVSDQVVNTLTKMSKLQAEHEFLDTLKRHGMGKFFFEKGKQPVPAVLIKADGNPKMEPLAGLYTYDWLLKELQTHFDPRPPSQDNERVLWLARQVKRAIATTKVGLTVYSTGTQIKNFASNPLIQMASGNWDLRKAWKAGRTIIDDWASTPDPEKREFVKKMYTLGVIDSGVNLQDVMANLDAANRDGLDKFVSSQKVLRGAKKAAIDAPMALYQAGDVVWKIYAFENFKARYGKVFPDMKPEELDQYAATLVLEETPSTAMANSQLLRTLRWMPMGSTFITFTAEMYRVTGNQIKRCISELKSDNPELKKSGFKRLIGLSTAMDVTGLLGYTLLDGLVAALGGASVPDDDDKEDYWTLGRPWDASKLLAHKSTQMVKDAKGDNVIIRLLPYSNIHAYGSVRDVVQAVMSGLSDDEASGLEVMTGVVSNVVGAGMEQFLDGNILAETWSEVSGNQDAYGNKIIQPLGAEQPNWYQVLFTPEGLTYTLKKLGPAPYKQWKRLQKSSDPNALGHNDWSESDAWASLYGLTVSTVDVRDQASRAYRSAKYAEGSAKKKLLNWLRVSRSPEEARELYGKASEQLKLQQEHARKVVASAERQGLPSQVIDKLAWQEGAGKKGTPDKEFERGKVLAGDLAFTNVGDAMAETYTRNPQAVIAMVEQAHALGVEGTATPQQYLMMMASREEDGKPTTEARIAGKMLKGYGGVSSLAGKKIGLSKAAIRRARQAGR